MPTMVTCQLVLICQVSTYPCSDCFLPCGQVHSARSLACSKILGKLFLGVPDEMHGAQELQTLGQIG